MQETWKRSISLEVSDQGRVRKSSSGRILSPTNRKNGYMNAPLHLLHELVLEAFGGLRPEGKVVNHKDGNKQNNAVDNLEWVTTRENANHAVRVLGRMKGEANGQCKLTDKEIEGIRAWRKQGGELMEIAALYKCSFQHVSDICRFKRRAA